MKKPAKGLQNAFKRPLEGLQRLLKGFWKDFEGLRNAFNKLLTSPLKTFRIAFSEAFERPLTKLRKAIERHLRKRSLKGLYTTF